MKVYFENVSLNIQCFQSRVRIWTKVRETLHPRFCVIYTKWRGNPISSDFGAGVILPTYTGCRSTSYGVCVCVRSQTTIYYPRQELPSHETECVKQLSNICSARRVNDDWESRQRKAPWETLQKEQKRNNCFANCNARTRQVKLPKLVASCSLALMYLISSQPE
jgi:hypothetical protein